MSDSTDPLSDRAKQATQRNRVWAWMSRQLGHDEEFSEDRFRTALATAAGAETVRQLLRTVPAASYQAAARIVAEETSHLDAELVETLWKANPRLIPVLAGHEALGGESWHELDALLADFFEKVFPHPSLKNADRLLPALEAIDVLLERGLYEERHRSLEVLPAPSSTDDPTPAEIVAAARASVPAFRDEDAGGG